MSGVCQTDAVQQGVLLPVSVKSGEEDRSLAAVVKNGKSAFLISSGQVVQSLLYVGAFLNSPMPVL